MTSNPVTSVAVMVFSALSGGSNLLMCSLLLGKKKKKHNRKIPRKSQENAGGSPGIIPEISVRSLA